MTLGRPPSYPLRGMAVGEATRLPAPTPADARRIRRNVSQYGLRRGRVYQCRTADGVTTVTRIN